jgi:hypothetical protein
VQSKRPRVRILPRRRRPARHDRHHIPPAPTPIADYQDQAPSSGADVAQEHGECVDAIAEHLEEHVAMTHAAREEKLLRAICQATSAAIERAIAEHERRYHGGPS